MTDVSLVHDYYRALDQGDYEALESILATEFTQERGDRVFESRAAFVAFMREDRPRFDTRHDVERTYRGPDDELAVVGELVTTDEAGAADAGSVLVEFLDVFTVAGDEIVHLRTFTRATP